MQKGFYRFYPKEKWEKRKISLENWESNWDNIQPFFKYGPQTRKIMYKTNTIESLNKGRQVFQTVQANVNNLRKRKIPFYDILLTTLNKEKMYLLR